MPTSKRACIRPRSIGKERGKEGEKGLAQNSVGWQGELHISLTHKSRSSMPGGRSIGLDGWWNNLRQMNKNSTWGEYDPQSGSTELCGGEIILLFIFLTEEPHAKPTVLACARVQYRGVNKGLFVLLSRTQAWPGRTVKQ